MTLVWIPTYANILGNELADCAMKEALSVSLLDQIPIPAVNIYRVGKQKLIIF